MRAQKTCRNQQFQRAEVSNRLAQLPGPEYISWVHSDELSWPFLRRSDAEALADYAFGEGNWKITLRSEHDNYTEFIEARGKFFVSLAVTIRVTLWDGTFREDLGCGAADGETAEEARIKALKFAQGDGVKRALRLFGQLTGNAIYDESFIKWISSAP